MVNFFDKQGKNLETLDLLWETKRAA